MSKKHDNSHDLAIVTGFRTPFCKAGGAMQRAYGADLAAHVIREVLDRTGIDPKLIDEVILGCAGPDAREANIARVAALRAGLPESIPAMTVMRWPAGAGTVSTSTRRSCPTTSVRCTARSATRSPPAWARATTARRATRYATPRSIG